MTFTIIATIAIVITATLFLLVLFEPGLRYDVQEEDTDLHSEQFLCVLGALCDAQVHGDSRLEVLTNADQFYTAELAAIRAAEHTINLEAFIFRSDETGRQFVEALTERARAGVKVNLVLDALGSFSTRSRVFDELRAAGGRVCWYQPLRWYTLKRYNNRTHRELMIIDGKVGFIGGAGIGDAWRTGEKGNPRWRDTVVRVTGDLVIGLQTTFAENWLEAAEEILAGKQYFALCGAKAGKRSESANAGDTESNADPKLADASGIVVISAPSAGRSTRARVLFQMLISSARELIQINSPYFLPDRSVQRAIIKAIERGVRVQVVVPDQHNDHAITRHASRRRYGHLLRHGVEIYEYKKSMIHVKCMIVDGIWSVIGSTNFDNRSFGLNDEVNLAAQSPALAERLREDFQRDMETSQQITYEQWKRRPLWAKFMETLGRLIERQQ